MDAPLILTAVFATFLLAGAVKGVIGLGLPTVSLGILTAVIDLPSAMALLLVPSFVTNVWQAAVGGNAVPIIRRIWPFLLLATGSVWLGAQALAEVDLAFLSALLGFLLVAYATVSLAGFHLSIDQRKQLWAGPLLGTVNGVLTGMTGSFVVPGVMYLQAIGLPRDMLIQAMGMLFTASTAALAIALQGNNLLTQSLGTVSALALIPAIVGMVLGQKVRQRLPEQMFRRIFFIAILALGLYIMGNAFLNLN